MESLISLKGNSYISELAVGGVGDLFWPVSQYFTECHGIYLQFYFLTLGSKHLEGWGTKLSYLFQHI